MVTKTRLAYSGNNQSRSSTAVGWHTNTQTFWDRTQIIISEEHGNWRSQADGGGPMLMVSEKYEIQPGYMDQAQAKGPFVISGVIGTTPPYSVPVQKSTSYGNAKGATAISRCLPTNPAAQMSTAIGELMHNGLPQVIGSTAFKSKVHAARKAGNEYLNYEFGWLPLVSDLRKFAYAVKHREQIMHGYLKYSDKQIRRRYLFPSTETSASTVNGAYVDAILAYHLVANVTCQSKVDEWFSGSFKYHIPKPVDFDSKVGYYSAEASKILGLELTPEVVWNLAPWSWAIDWFSNTGDVIHNISRLGKDGLVMRYGYEMYRMESSRQVIAVGNRPETDGFSSSYKKTEKVQMRWAATPYGFGLTFNGLSDQQKAIVIALGLSRAF
jgi:hypothetical protein